MRRWGRLWFWWNREAASCWLLAASKKHGVPQRQPASCHLDRVRRSEATEDEWRNPEDASSANADSRRSPKTASATFPRPFPNRDGLALRRIGAARYRSGTVPG